MTSKDFLGQLADQLNTQFDLGENTTTSLDLNGQKYGSLGDFATKFDQSAERKYVEEGYLRRDPYHTDPKQFEILWQEPNASVLVKKRMFSSVAENYRPDYMDADEKLYYKAIRVLFQNKCRQIAALEQLGKIQKMTAAVGDINTQLVPWIMGLGDLLSGGFFKGGADAFFGGNSNPLTTQGASSFIKTTDRLRTLFGYNQTNPLTTWITNSTDMYQSLFGSGTGVIEVTNFTSITTNSSVDLKQPGTFSLSIEDPYESMLITDYDIEVALSDASNLFYNKKIFQFGLSSSNQIISDQKNQLNTLRSARNASPITFKVDPDTLLGRRVIAIIDRLGKEIDFTYDSTGGTGFPGLGGFGDSVSVSDDYLRGGSQAGYDGLDTQPGYTGLPWTKSAVSKTHGNSELDAFKAVVNAIFQQMQLLGNSPNGLNIHNDQYNYVRRRLRFNFSGRLIIQPMDTVHIYMNSKSQFDHKVLSGLSQMFSGFGILQNINNTLTGLKNAYDTLFNPSGNISIAAEKAMYVGPDFPNYLWSLIRTQFVTEKEGTHVFAGVVDSAVDNWSDGRFFVDVAGKDNTVYFDQGKVNFKPGVNSFNGLIFDPLTPFKSSFDTVTVNNAPTSGLPTLLDENMYLLSQTGAQSLAKYKSGSLAGEKATQGNYIQDQNIDQNTGRLTRVFHAPDGLVYKWKQGIGVFTQFGSSADINNPNLVGSANIFQEPFAGLDVMNVLSLLIAGVPYNFATYYKATSNFYNFKGDPQSKQSAAYSFAQSLQTGLTDQNRPWGNFVPFKNLIMNESMVAEALKLQQSASNRNDDLDKKLRDLADLNNAAVAQGAVNALLLGNARAPENALASKIENLKTQISSLQKDINKSIDKIREETAKFYNQTDRSAAFDSNFLVDGKNDPADSSSRQLIRKQINYLTKRMSYEVRANEDKNLFIVDDYYDIDYDIAAFNKSLTGGIPMFSSDFTSVREKILNVADLLNLEVFCDSQGHIRVRPPQYNRMPSSVFNRMIYLKRAYGVQIFPAFLNSLFTDQLKSLKDRIEIIEDKIRLDCAVLGQYPSLDVQGDETAYEFLTSEEITSGLGGTFTFVSDSSGNISDINNLIKQANQELSNQTIDQSLGNFDAILAAGTSTKQLFANVERYNIIVQGLQSQNQSASGSNVNANGGTSVFQTSVVQQLINRIFTKSGQHIVSKDYLTPPNANQPVEIDTGQKIDVFKVANDLTTNIQQWQVAVKAFYHTIKNTAEYRSLDDDNSTSNSIANPGLFQNTHIPEVYEHMIEDESYDDYGPGSGTRYIIKRSQIKNISISENAPPWTSVEVQGILSPFFKENEATAGLEAFPGGGNAQVTALAVDYDMWRNYGFKSPAVLKVPFLTDPLTQCGPFAAMVLTRNRSNILRGSITISGNEYMQVGEVIYLEDRNLLFYVNGVQHSLTPGRGFTTRLDLTYGHSIGEYIPTYLDTVGKLLYKNQENTDTIIHRQNSSSPERHVGIIQLDGKVPFANVVGVGSENDFISSYSNANSTVINNILYNTAYMLNANGTPGNNIEAHIELRIYYDNSHPVNSELNSQLNDVIDILTGDAQGPKNLAGQNQPVQNYTIERKWIDPQMINLDDDSDRRSPSQQAIDGARNQMKVTSTNSGNSNNSNIDAIKANNDALRTALFSYIIDCWVTYKQVPDTIASKAASTPGN